MTEDLSKLSESISNAAEKAIEIEVRIFEKVKGLINTQHETLADISCALSRLDVVSSLAEVSILNSILTIFVKK